MAYEPPLTGVRVLDLADESAVFAGRLLADLGADVITVEPPDGGRLRRLAPFLGGEPGPERSLPHLYHGAGKRSVVIDRTTQAGRARFLGLVGTADALIETEVIDDAELRGRNPSLIHVTVTPFGLEGPWAGRKGNDLVASAAGGLAYVCGSPGDPPSQPGADQSYKMAGLTAATGVVIALTGRAGQPGELGVHLDISVQESVAVTTIQTSHPAYWLWNGRIPKRPGLTAVHKCADGGWVTLMVRPDRLQVFCDWAEEAGLALPQDRAELRDRSGATRLGLLVRALAAKYDRDEFMKRAWDLDLLGLPVNTLPDLETCDHLVQTEQFLEVPDDTSGTNLSFPRSPLDAIGTVKLRRAPRLGEHTAEVLESLDTEAPTSPPGRGSTLDLAHALDGIRVVDFCWVIAGPLGTRVLANFGAEVIRIESGRRAFPEEFPKGERHPSIGAFHNVLNTQKKSITLDPRSPRGRELLLELIAAADVVTSNYRPGALEEMGYGDDVLRSVNPRIINLEVPGCGSRGPWAQRGSYGNMVNASAGINFLSGFPGRAPRGMGVAYPDFTSPYLMTLLVLGALRERDRTGEGARIELNQLAATVSLIGVEWLQYKSTGTPPPMRGNRDPNWCPHGLYPAAGEDEWLALAVETEAEFAALCDVIGRPEVAGDSRFAGHVLRKENEDDLDEIVKAWTAVRDKWEAADLLQARGIAAAPVENVADCVERDPQLARHYQTVSQPSHPDVCVPVQGNPIQKAFARRPVGRAPM